MRELTARRVVLLCITIQPCPSLQEFRFVILRCSTIYLVRRRVELYSFFPIEATIGVSGFFSPLFSPTQTHSGGWLRTLFFLHFPRYFFCVFRFRHRHNCGIVCNDCVDKVVFKHVS